MLTREQVLDAVRSGRESACLDGRDYVRLASFFPLEHLELFGFTLKPGELWVSEEWSESNVKKRLAEDVAFAFEKALNRRGISADMMNGVVKMWLWILEDPLQYDKQYAFYGLPLLKKVAVKYDLPNPIGEDTGTERKYTEQRTF